MRAGPFLNSDISICMELLINQWLDFEDPPWLAFILLLYDSKWSGMYLSNILLHKRFRVNKWNAILFFNRCSTIKFIIKLHIIYNKKHMIFLSKENWCPCTTWNIIVQKIWNLPKLDCNTDTNLKTIFQTVQIILSLLNFISLWFQIQHGWHYQKHC